MTSTTETPVRAARRLGRACAAGVLALFAFMLCAAAAPAATKDFTLAISPSSVLAGRVADMTATLVNRTKTQQLGSANLTPPQGYTVLGITSLSRPAPATATLAGDVVQLRNLSLPAGGAVTVAMQVSAPCSGPATSTWSDVVAKQANDFSGLPGNNLTLDVTRSSLTSTTLGTCTPCPEDERCAATLGGAAGSSSTVTSDPSATQPDAGVLTIFSGEPLDCAGYNERSPDTFVADAPQNRPKFGTLTFSSSTRAVTSKDPLEVCYGSPTPFEVKPKTLQTTVSIGGQLHFVGRLPNCIGLAPPPCVTNRDNTARVITFSMPTGDPRFS